MKESKTVKSVLASIVVVALVLPFAAQASDKPELAGTSVKVSYADLNVEKQEGAKALYRRLKQASRKACGFGDYRIAGSLTVAARIKQCYRDSLSSAVESLDNDLVTKIHNS